MRRTLAVMGVAVLVVGGCSGDDDTRSEGAGIEAMVVDDWVYQLEGYPDGRLDELIEAPQPLAVIDLARDGGSDYFTAEEIAALRDSGKTVLAYFSIGTIEAFRPEHGQLPGQLILNQWPEWPDEHFVRYWEQAWWDLVVRPRLDQAIAAGFDGAYLDTPLAYEEIDPALVPDLGRDALAEHMVALITQIGAYAKERTPGFLIVPQNSPELREYAGYTEAIDGIGVEELFFAADDQSSDHPCVEDWCAENLEHVRALRDAGKLVLAVDYASDPDNVAEACRRYVEERFTGYVTTRALDTISSPCP